MPPRIHPHRPAAPKGCHRVDISIVVPAYNEERRLTPTLQGWAAWMDGVEESVELVVSDDG
ncbi:MAG TPA: hypothetical protein DEP24_04010, partial [Mycobacterium sp.]|nr:hypothetical protein [Mycobacterium sp.]